MAVTLEVTEIIDGDERKLEFRVAPGSTIPSAIFVHENLGTTTLGGFQGTCTFNELFTIQEYVGTPIPTAGNRFVRVSVGSFTIPYNQNKTDVINSMIKNISLFKREYEAGSVTTVTTHSVP